MASQKILEGKQKIVAEIVEKIKNNESVVVFEYQGLNVSDLTEVRKELQKIGSEIKVYKNTLVRLAAKELNLEMEDFLKGPNAILFGKELLEPIKIVSEFAKKNDKVNIRVGVISGSVADKEVIREYAEIPSREGLLTMLAGGMIQYVKDLAVGLDLYAKDLEGKDE